MLPGPPLDCYRDQPKPVPPEIDELDEDEAIPLDEDALVCRRCGSAITTQTFARAVDDLFARVLAGSLAPMIDRLIESRRLSPTEIDELRDMLDQYSDDAESES